ncbi:MAG: CBS domain-containing protein [Gammaproteobacteria bacterium]|jgi:CBS domain-containing protein
MSAVSDILNWKGDDVWSVTPDTKVLAALELMAEKEVGAVIVLDDGRLAGIFTERDYARKVVLAGRSSRDAAVREVMTTQVVCVAPERSADECLALITDKRVRHLPVVHEKRVVGIVSIGDLVKAKIADQEHTIEQLHGYIAGQF